jgi:hypothetical protein
MITGLVKPNIRMLWAICRIWRLECVRAFLANGVKAEGDLYSTKSDGKAAKVGPERLEFIISPTLIVAGI